MPSGNFAGGWQRKPHQRAFMTCYNSGYADVLIERVKYVMDELGVDVIYTDSTSIPHDCANTSHGCGYYDKDGNLLDYDAVRDTYYHPLIEDYEKTLRPGSLLF